MLEGIAFFLIVLASCIICGRAMATPRSSAPVHRLPSAKSEEVGENEPSVLPAKPLPKWHPFRLDANVILCSCGQWNQSDAEACWSCDRALTTTENRTITLDATERCHVCTYWIYPSDRVAICPACKTQGHYAHAYEYVRAKGQCPRCGRKLLPGQLLIAAAHQD